MTILLQESGIDGNSTMYKSMIELFLVCGGRDRVRGDRQTTCEYDVQIVDSDVTIVDNKM
jgi:hypothetical protein